MTILTSFAAWRRILLIGITALIALLAVSFSAPQDAHAIISPNIVRANHVGWVKVKDEPRACPAIYPAPAYCSQPSPVVAWRWNGVAWNQTSIAGGTDVYVYPYSSPWHWIWTQRTGWLAITNSSLDTGYSCIGFNCPVF